jgi:hypothetical protein
VVVEGAVFCGQAAFFFWDQALGSIQTLFEVPRSCAPPNGTTWALDLHLWITSGLLESYQQGC